MMDEDELAFERAVFATRFADVDGAELASLLRREWGAEHAQSVIGNLERAAVRLSLLARSCRLAARLLREV
jgi:hypothetical protein